MKSSLVFAFICSAIFCLPLHGQNLKVEQTGAKHSKRGRAITIYTINDSAVTEKKFNEFLTGLKEIEGTWYCAETTTGGRTGYEAKDKNGMVYVYKAETDLNKNLNSISTKKELK
jgi:hypothetical protein